MQLRRIVTAGQICLISFWKGELLLHEATVAIEVVIALCEILNTRWEAAAKVLLTFRELARVSGTSFPWRISATRLIIVMRKGIVCSASSPTDVIIQSDRMIGSKTVSSELLDNSQGGLDIANFLLPHEM